MAPGKVPLPRLDATDIADEQLRMLEQDYQRCLALGNQCSDQRSATSKETNCDDQDTSNNSSASGGTDPIEQQSHNDHLPDPTATPIRGKDTPEIPKDHLRPIEISNEKAEMIKECMKDFALPIPAWALSNESAIEERVRKLLET